MDVVFDLPVDMLNFRFTACFTGKKPHQDCTLKNLVSSLVLVDEVFSACAYTKSFYLIN